MTVKFPLVKGFKSVKARVKKARRLGLKEPEG
jgi:hypothetical protein